MQFKFILLKNYLPTEYFFNRSSFLKNRRLGNSLFFWFAEDWLIWVSFKEKDTEEINLQNPIAMFALKRLWTSHLISKFVIRFNSKFVIRSWFALLVPHSLPDFHLQKSCSTSMALDKVNPNIVLLPMILFLQLQDFQEDFSRHWSLKVSVILLEMASERRKVVESSWLVQFLNRAYIRIYSINLQT